MKVLVTGAAGFIGSHVVDLLLKFGHTVWCIDDLSTGKRENLPSDVEFAKVNVASWFDLVAEFVDFEPEAVIHLAAQPSLSESVDNPIRDAHVNIMGTVNCLRAAQKVGVKKFVLASTSAVYSDNIMVQDFPIKEDYPFDPSSPYGISKMTCEFYAKNLFPDGYSILRFGNVYGPRQVPLGENQLVPHIIEHFEKAEKFYIKGDGLQSRDFVYVENVARACVYALDSRACTCNIASGEARSVNEIAQMIAEIYGVPEYVFEHTDEQDPRRVVWMDIERAKAFIDWEPTTPIAEGLRRTVEWWQSRKEK